VPDSVGVGLRKGDESGHRCRARRKEVPLVVAGDDLDIELSILTVGSRGPVRIQVLDSACLLAPGIPP